MELDKIARVGQSSKSWAYSHSISSTLDLAVLNTRWEQREREDYLRAAREQVFHALSSDGRQLDPTILHVRTDKP